MKHGTAKLLLPPDDAASAPAPAQATAPAHGAPKLVQPPATIRIRLWDLPLRVFHWSLALLVLAAFVTAKVGGPWMEWHGRAGIAIVGLLAFRLVWGLIGSTHARFLSFAPTPGRLLAYVRGRWQGVGHNPLGALSVFAVLGLLAVQTGIGLFANDDIDFNGPLSDLIEKERSDSLTGLHHQLSNVVLVLVGLHIAAVLFYVLFKKNNLIKPMLTGWKEVNAVQAVRHAQGGIAALSVALAAAFGAMVVASGKPFQETALPAPSAPVAADTSAPAAAPAPPPSTPAW
jgi:cytochrome b